MGIFQKINNRKILRLSCLHFLISLVLSTDFFHPIRENAGGENVAYKFLQTGLVLPEDGLSRLLCHLYAYVLAFLLIYIFWTWLFQLLDIWKKKIVKRSWVAAYIAFIVIGIMIIAIVYPSTIINATDTTWNYVYAREWLPIYWHGFFTNVVHCACMIVFPHPIMMSIIPFLFGISEVCYFIYIAFVKFPSYNRFIKIIMCVGGTHINAGDTENTLVCRKELYVCTAECGLYRQLHG